MNGKQFVRPAPAKKLPAHGKGVLAEKPGFEPGRRSPCFAGRHLELYQSEPQKSIFFFELVQIGVGVFCREMDLNIDVLDQ